MVPYTEGEEGPMQKPIRMSKIQQSIHNQAYFKSRGSNKIFPIKTEYDHLSGIKNRMSVSKNKKKIVNHSSDKMTQRKQQRCL